MRYFKRKQFKKLQKDDYYIHTKHCAIKYRNNLIEQDC
ncbi:hypothetical protein II5_05956 [Bacillus cereus MSX-A1]|nr:hypothetical protein II5_05956 [Bacillus cereus MSX-A1]